jgi:hypothetical protein
MAFMFARWYIADIRIPIGTKEFRKTMFLVFILDPPNSLNISRIAAIADAQVTYS